MDGPPPFGPAARVKPPSYFMVVAAERAHWASVWDQLAVRFYVVAPELPGVVPATEPPLPTFGVYARWLEDLLVRNRQLLDPAP